MQPLHEKDFEKLFYQHTYINVINTLVYVVLEDTTFREDLRQKSNHLKNSINNSINVKVNKFNMSGNFGKILQVLSIYYNVNHIIIQNIFK